MDITTLQMIATLVNQIGLPATFGVILIMTAWYLLPVLADYLRAKIAQSNASTHAITQQTNGSSMPKGIVPTPPK